MRRLFRIMESYNRQMFEKEPTAWHLLFREIGRQGWEAYLPDRRVVWTTAYAFPMEMLRPLGLIPIDFELHSGLFSSFGLTEQALREAHRLGLPMDTCTVHRVAIGAAFAKRFPNPHLLVSTTHYCDGKPKTNEFLQTLFDVEYLLIDVPQSRDREAKRYLESQLRSVYERLCRLAGCPCEEERLQEPVRHFNEMTRLLRRIEEIRQRKPSPFLPGNRGFSIHFFATLLYGTPQLNEVYRLLIGELERSLESDGGEEAFRFLWLMAGPTYPQNIFETLQDFGVRIVAEELGRLYWEELDEMDPIGSMAERILNNPWLGPLDRRIDLLRRTIREYRIDGVIHFCHLPCRQSNGALWLLKEAAEGMGARFINLEADINDPSSFSPERVRNQIIANIEILKGKK